MLLETPAVVVDGKKLLANIQDMSQYAQAHDFILRPHIKAHRLPEIAKMQQDHGAQGFTCAKVGEAAMLQQHQFDNLLIAHQLASPDKFQRLAQLLSETEIIIGCDSLAGANMLQQLAAEQGKGIDIALEIDSGLRRCGTLPGQDTLDLAESIRRQCPDLRIKGLFTHAGQAYAATGGPEQLQKLLRQKVMLWLTQPSCCKSRF